MSNVCLAHSHHVKRCFVKEFIGARRRLYELDEILEHELLVFAVVGRQLLPL
jgi:hypothetical protein